MATAVHMGNNVEIKDFAVNTSDVPLTFVNQPNNLLIRARGEDTLLQLRTEENATDYFTVPAGQSVTIELHARSNTPLYVRTAAGADTVEVLAMYE